MEVVVVVAVLADVDNVVVVWSSELVAVIGVSPTDDITTTEAVVLAVAVLGGALTVEFLRDGVVLVAMLGMCCDWDETGAAAAAALCECKGPWSKANGDSSSKLGS